MQPSTPAGNDMHGDAKAQLKSFMMLKDVEPPTVGLADGGYLPPLISSALLGRVGNLLLARFGRTYVETT